MFLILILIFALYKEVKNGPNRLGVALGLPWGCLGVAVESPWGFRRTGVEIEHFRIFQNGTFTKIWNRLELDMNLPWDRLGVALGCLSQHRAYNSGLGR